MPYAAADDGVKLYYEETGAGVPVIFVHEFAGDLRSWEAQLRHFGQRYRTIAYFEGTSDLRVWAAAEHVMHSSEQPILAGLYFILDHRLAHARSADRWDNHVRVARRGNEGPLGLEFDA